MKVFIDANIFHAFLGADSDLSQLIELKRLLKAKKNPVELILTRQVIDEYHRNAGDRINDAWESLNGEKDKKELSAIKFSSEKKKKFAARIGQLEKDITNFNIARLEDFDKRTAKAEKIIAEIFSLATILECPDEIVGLAKIRHLRGNPPMKNDQSYGDAINWEALLKTGYKEDIRIVSNDPDYAEKVKGKKELNRYLKNEWSEKTGKDATLYTSLGTFINKLEKKETIKEEAIEKELKNSRSMTYPIGLVEYIASGANQSLQTMINPNVINTLITAREATAAYQERLNSIIIPLDSARQSLTMGMASIQNNPTLSKSLEYFKSADTKLEGLIGASDAGENFTIQHSDINQLLRMDRNNFNLPNISDDEEIEKK